MPQRATTSTPYEMPSATSALHDLPAAPASGRFLSAVRWAPFTMEASSQLRLHVAEDGTAITLDSVLTAVRWPS